MSGKGAQTEPPQLLSSDKAHQAEGQDPADGHREAPGEAIQKVSKRTKHLRISKD